MLNIGSIQVMIHQLVESFTGFSTKDLVIEKKEDFEAFGEMCAAGQEFATVGSRVLEDGIVTSDEGRQLDAAWGRFQAASKHFGREVADLTTLGGTGAEEAPVDDPDVPTDREDDDLIF